jgi:hypothetical protein
MVALSPTIVPLYHIRLLMWQGHNVDRQVLELHRQESLPRQLERGTDPLTKLPNLMRTQQDATRHHDAELEKRPRGLLPLRSMGPPPAIWLPY